MKDEFNSRIQDIGQLEDVAEIRVKLAELSDDMAKVFDDSSIMEENNKKLSAENEKLRSANGYKDCFNGVGRGCKEDCQ